MGSIGFAFLFEAYSFSIPSLSVEAHHHSSSWFLLGCAGTAGLLFLSFIYQDTHRWITHRFIQPQTEDIQYLIEVSGMTCGGCVRKLERILSESDLVSHAHVSRDPDRVQIHGQGSHQEMCTLIQSAGFIPNSSSL